MPGKYLELLWPAVLTGGVPRKHAAACRYLMHVPDPLSAIDLQLDADAVGAVSEAEQSVRDLNDTQHPALEPLAWLLLRTESIASSKIEGMQVDARHLARAEAKRSLDKRIGPETERVLANIGAMQLAIDTATQAGPLSVAHLSAVHHQLMAGDINYHAPGEVRTRQNWIGGNNYTPCGADFVPPSADRVPALLDDLCAYVARDTESPLVQAALAHAQFETIHPFADGNGRTGRALIHIVLRRRGLARTFVPPVSLVFAAHRHRYIDALMRFRDGDAAAWIVHFANATTHAARTATRYLQQVDALRASWREQLRAHRPVRADAVAWQIIDQLPAQPMVTGPGLVQSTDRTKAAVSQAIDDLCAAGILRAASEHKRNRLYEAPELMALLRSLELEG